MSHIIVFRGKGLWVGLGMRWFRCNIPPHGTVIVVCVLQREFSGDSRLSVLADAHHMELFTPGTLRPTGHTHSRFCLCLCHFQRSHVRLLLFHSTTFSFSMSLHIALYLPFFPLPFALCVVSLCVPSGFCVSVLWFILFSR